MSIRIPNAPVGVMEIERQLATCYKVLRKIADTACSHGNPTLDRCGPCMAGSFLAQSRIYNPAEAAAPTLPPVGERDWPEDFGHENGQYYNKCIRCGAEFMGYKRRVTCRVCAHPPVGERETLPVCHCAEYYGSHALDCPARLAYERALASRPSPAPSGEPVAWRVVLTFPDGVPYHTYFLDEADRAEWVTGFIASGKAHGTVTPLYAAAQHRQWHEWGYIKGECPPDCRRHKQRKERP